MQTLCGPFSYFTCSGLLGSLQPNHCSRSSKVQTALKPQTPGSDRTHTATDSSENALCLHASAAPEMVSKPLCGQESGDHYHSVGMNQTQSMVCLFFCQCKSCTCFSFPQTVKLWSHRWQAVMMLNFLKLTVECHEHFNPKKRELQVTFTSDDSRKSFHKVKNTTFESIHVAQNKTVVYYEI